MKNYFIKISVICLLFITAFILIGYRHSNNKRVLIKDYNRKWYFYTDKVIVGEIISAAGIKINKQDLIYPSLDKNIDQKNSEITICRVKQIYKTKLVPIHQRTIIVPSNALPEGTQLKTVAGQKGYKEEVYDVLFINGEKVKEQLVDVRLICKPRRTIILKGKSKEKKIQKQSNLKKGTIISLHSTAYSPAAASCAPFDDGYTALGLKAGYGVVAIDPTVIPLSTALYIRGYGYAIAGDVGSAIKNNDVDLCFSNELIAMEYGVKEVTAYVLR